MIVLTALAVLLLVGMIALVPLGLRAGDRPDDAVLRDVAALAAPPRAAVTITNRSDRAVVVGLSLRRPRPRLWMEGGAYVRIRTGNTTDELLADRQTQLGVLDAGETQTFAVAADADIRRRAELVAVIGQHERLRTIHRLVMLPSPVTARINA